MGNCNISSAAAAGDGSLPPAASHPLIHRPDTDPPPRPRRATLTGPGRVLGRPMRDVGDTHVLGHEIGRGQFGVTYLCTDRGSGELRACKAVAVRRLLAIGDAGDLRREVQVMYHLSGHRNVVELKGVYEDRQSVNLVMEYCAGGELFDRIIAKGHYSERAAAVVFRQIVTVVHYCHSMGVMHRDLKPENFLFLHAGDDSPLKAIDFGLSVFFKPGEVFKDFVGTSYYVAPEVVRRNYGVEADIWSAGVILYILLSGSPPFWAGTDQGIFDAVLRGNIDFSSVPWPSISSSAKDLVKKMLQQDPKERISALEVLNHPWILEGGNASDEPIDFAVLTILKQFTAMNKLKKVALKIWRKACRQKERFLRKDSDIEKPSKARV